MGIKPARHGPPLAMRVGVNTGEVVVRAIRKDDLRDHSSPKSFVDRANTSGI